MTEAPVVQIIKPSDQDLLEHYTQGYDTAALDGCALCHGQIADWTDYNGQKKCRSCGITFQVLGCHIKVEYLEANGLTEQDIAKVYCDCYDLWYLYKTYHEETDNKIPAGMFIDRSSQNKGLLTVQHYADFYTWLLDNRDRCQAFEADFDWALMQDRYGRVQLVGGGGLV